MKAAVRAKTRTSERFFAFALLECTLRAVGSEWRRVLTVR
jgi:hypothetical protein